jgi:glycine betaine/proline transport system ATP-binding protein
VTATTDPAAAADAQTAGTGSQAAATLSVRHLWKVFGDAEHKVVGTPDAELSREELRRKTGAT